MYAIVKTGGKQYTVRPGDAINVEKIPGEPGDKVSLDVLLLSDGKQIVTDADKIAGKVTAQIVEQFKGKKQLVFKFKKRKGYKRTKGHRQQLTRIAIIDVNGEKAEAPKPKKKSDDVVTEAPKAAKEKPAKTAEKPKAAKAAPKKEAPKAEKKAEAPKAPKADAKPADEKQDLSKMTVAQLKEFAKDKDIHIASGLRKAEIIEAIENALAE